MRTKQNECRRKHLAYEMVNAHSQHPNGAHFSVSMNFACVLGFATLFDTFVTRFFVAWHCFSSRFLSLQSLIRRWCRSVNVHLVYIFREHNSAIQFTNGILFDSGRTTVKCQSAMLLHITYYIDQIHQTLCNFSYTT